MRLVWKNVNLRCALDIILETAMRDEMDIQNKRNARYASVIENIMHILAARQLIPR